MKNNFVCFLILCMVGLVSLPTLAQDDLLSRINGLRASLGLAPYSVNGALASAASNHARWMVDTGQVSHIQFDGSSPRDRARAAGYSSTWVSENIYMGGIAGSGDAWNFWVNSPIHYAGLTSPNYDNVGIGTANGSGGNSFVLVFGNSSGAVRTVSTSNSATSGNDGGGAPSQPSFVVGLDANGNIMHEVQPSDTLGEIMLIYGYSWDRIPSVLELNGMTQADIRFLKVGSVLLVPPQSGTYTPTVAPTSEFTATPTASFTPPPTSTQPTPVPTLGELPPPAVFNALTPQPTDTPPPTQTPIPTETPSLTPTESVIIRTLPPPTTLAMLSTPIPLINVNAPSPVEEGGLPWWLGVAVLFQLGVLAYATVTYFRKR